jgi:hypothetical protein
MFVLKKLKMSDESVMSLVFTAFAIFVIAWAYYQYLIRQKKKSMSAEEILKSWAEFQKEPAIKVKPTLKKATTRRKTVATKPGLYANIHKKQARIEKEKAEGKPVEKMRKPGTKGAPTAKAFEQSAKTAKKK